MANRFFITRHGESSFNAGNLKIGQLDPGLTATGKRQATELARAVENLPISRVFCSDLIRASETAHLAAPLIRATPDKRLREVHLGTFQGLNPSQLARSSLWASRALDVYGFKPPGGESYRELEARVRDFLISLGDELEGILLVTHIGVIRILALIAEDLSRKEVGRLEAGHCSLWSATWSEGRLFDFSALPSVYPYQKLYP